MLVAGDASMPGLESDCCGVDLVLVTMHLLLEWDGDTVGCSPGGGHRPWGQPHDCRQYGSRTKSEAGSERH